jgi:cyclohexanecarboxylate-CoA ligase
MDLAHIGHALAAEYRAAGLWRDLTLDAQFDQVAGANGARIAVIDETGSTTYSELANLVSRAGAAFAGLGIERGDVVSWMLPNRVEAAVAHHALVRIGAISNPIIPIYRHREVRFILGQAGSKAVVIPRRFRNFDFVDMIDDIRADVPALEHVIVLDDDDHDDDGASIHGHLDWHELMSSSKGELPAAAHSPDDPVLLLYTSGTTADPKGALHSHNTLEHENRTIVDLYGLTAEDIVFMPSPVTHITGVLYGLNMPVVLGSTVVFQAIWDTDVALDLLEEHRATFVVGATPFLHGLTYHDSLPRRDLALRVFACGGADVPPQLIIDASDRLNCCATRVYGSTEYPTLTGSGQADRLVKRANTDGRLIGAAECRIVDEGGNDVGAGDVGEIVARGPEMFLGYLDPEASAAAALEGGWFQTGDLAYIDADGYVTITGRKKDIIVRGGENLSAKEIEDLLFEHHSVEEVAVVGMPDPVMVERVCAFVVPSAGANPKLGELIEHLRSKQVASQKLPERLEIAAELPKTASGKVQKFRLRDQITQLLLEESNT